MAMSKCRECGNVGIIACLWECDENYKKEKLQKNKVLSGVI